MKAVVYNKKSHPDKLVFCDIDIPVPNGNEVLIKVRAVSLNAADYRSMKMGMIPKRKIFGADHVIDRRYSLDRAADAMYYLKQGHSTGKVMINTDYNKDNFS